MKPDLRAAAIAWAIIIAPAANDARHRALGAAPAFASIVRIDAGDQLVGTGSLIAPSWILTAAHVVADRSDGSLAVRVRDRRLAVRRAVAHPQWQGRIDDPDLALLELAAPLLDLSPVRLAADLPGLGSEVTLVGYGAGGTRAEDRGVKRGATNIIDQAGGSLRGVALSGWHLLIDFDDGVVPNLNALGDSLSTALEGIDSGGDSGGPWLVFAADGWRITAVYHVTSYRIGQAMSATPRFGGAVAMGVGIAAHRAWIDSILNTPHP